LIWEVESTEKSWMGEINKWKREEPRTFGVAFLFRLLGLSMKISIQQAVCMD